MKTALVVIDVQSYFLKRSPQDLPTRIVGHINNSSYECVAFTIFKNEDDSAWERNLHWQKCKNPEDLEIAPEFEEFANKSNIFTKSAYSSFKNHAFCEYLKSFKIEKLEICGVDLDGCVLAKAYEGFDLGYEIEILFRLSHSRVGFYEAAKSIVDKNIQTKNS